MFSVMLIYSVYNTIFIADSTIGDQCVYIAH